ncbi:hypothetical protein ACFQZE_10840 [Paenibacillus sp. GCM10027627]|uniref:hypothetical protein n=1 Tax=unclassified Paenibacillus TaxID=185978 RepID=UPI003639BE12
MTTTTSINFNGGIVQTLNLGLKKNILKVDNNRQYLSSTQSSVDYRIASRRNIGARLHSSASKVNAVHSRLKSVNLVVDQAIAKYETAESESNRFAANIGKIIASLGVIEDVYSFLNKIDSEKMLRISKDLRFHMFEINGNTYIKIVGASVTRPGDYINYRNILTQGLGHYDRWNKNFVRKLAGAGVLIHDGTRYTQYKNKLKGTNFPGLDKAMERLQYNRWKSAGTTLVKELNPLTDYTGWKGATNLTKFSKGLGIFGTLVTVGANVFDPELSGRQKVVNSVVDIASGTAAMAVGAAAGSFILPPLGTVVGAGVGLAVNAAINWPVPFLDGKSVVDYTKEKVNKLVDEGIDNLKDVANNIGNTLDKIFW